MFQNLVLLNIRKKSWKYSKCNIPPVCKGTFSESFRKCRNSRASCLNIFIEQKCFNIPRSVCLACLKQIQIFFNGTTSCYSAATPALPWALWGWWSVLQVGSTPAWLGRSWWHPVRILVSLIPTIHTPKRMRHTLVLQEIKIPALVWLEEARQESEFHFPSSCPWVYFNISSSCREGQQSGSWESTKGLKNWQNSLVFFFFGVCV